jgi:hypothetical protein
VTVAVAVPSPSTVFLTALLALVGGALCFWLRGKKYTGWLALGTIMGVIVLTWFAIPEYAQSAKSSDSCPPIQPIGDRPPRLAEGLAPAPLTLEKPEGVVINFSRDRSVHSKLVFLQVAKGSLPKGQRKLASPTEGTVFTVSQRPLERAELDGVIGSSQYVAVATVTRPREVGLSVCVDPTEFQVDPGTYTGSVTIRHPMIETITVPVSVTLQYPGYRWVVPLLAVVTFLAGSFFVWASHQRARSEEVWTKIGDLPGWLVKNYVGVTGGAIAAVSVFIAKEWRSPAWGAMAPEDWFALLGSLFTAYTATLTAATAIAKPKDEPLNVPNQ